MAAKLAEEVEERAIVEENKVRGYWLSIFGIATIAHVECGVGVVSVAV